MRFFWWTTSAATSIGPTGAPPQLMSKMMWSIVYVNKRWDGGDKHPGPPTSLDLARSSWSDRGLGALTGLHSVIQRVGCIQNLGLERARGMWLPNRCRGRIWTYIFCIHLQMINQLISYRLFSITRSAHDWTKRLADQHHHVPPSLHPYTCTWPMGQ